MKNDLDERDAGGGLTDWALARVALADHDCECHEDGLGTCLGCVCERAMRAERSRAETAEREKESAERDLLFERRSSATKLDAEKLLRERDKRTLEDAKETIRQLLAVIESENVRGAFTMASIHGYVGVEADRVTASATIETARSLLQTREGTPPQGGQDNRVAVVERDLEAAREALRAMFYCMHESEGECWGCVWNQWKSTHPDCLTQDVCRNQVAAIIGTPLGG